MAAKSDAQVELMADQRDPTLSEPTPPPYSASAPYPSPTENQFPPAADAPLLDPKEQSCPAPANPPPACDGDPPAAENNLTTDNPEDGFEVETKTFTFDDQSVRLGFIRKVYALLALQMLFTVILSCVFMFVEEVRVFIQTNFLFYIAAYIIFVVLYILLACDCCKKVARICPVNVIFFCIFTMSLAYMVAAITSFHDTQIVLVIFLLTLVSCLSIMLFSCQTKYDFTTWRGLIFVLLISVIFSGLFLAILVPTGLIRIDHMGFAALGSLTFTEYLARDTQLVVGGKKHEISPEDYVFAAMMLYVDIIYMFREMLSRFGGNNGGE